MELKTKNIGKTFSGVNVLRNVDFDLKPGEVHALVGENGAGKSTFVKILSGVYTPTEGKIFLENYFGKLPQKRFIKLLVPQTNC